MVIPGRECVWCGSAANSKEHVFPQWLHKLDGPSRYIAQHGGFQESAPRLVARHDHNERWVEYEAIRGTRAPNLHKVEVKAVCKKCNENWMSQLEQSAKPIIRRLIEGDDIDLTVNDLETLASWAHKTFLMYDQWEESPDRRYRGGDYRAFYADRIPPSHVRLYLAHSPSATFGMWSDSRCVIPPGADAQSYMDAHSPNCGSSWLAVDGMVIVEHWFSPDYPSQDRLRKFGRSVRASSHHTMRKLGAHEIWPAPHELHGWPRRRLDFKEMQAARLSLYNALRSRGVFARRTSPPT